MPKDYESLFIIKADLSDEEIEKEIEAVTSIALGDGGTTIELSKWGKKRLAYTIKKQRYGFYTLFRFSADPKIPEKLTRHFRLNESIIKGMVVIFDGAAGKGNESEENDREKSSAPESTAKPVAEAAKSVDDNRGRGCKREQTRRG